MIRATATDGRPATAVAVADGTIAAFGAATDAAFAGLKGPITERVDLNGRGRLPGFQDAHAHPAFAGVTMVGCNLIGAATLDEAISRIEAYVAAHPDKEWISGSGWRMEWFERGTPSRQQLDQLTGGRPAFLLNRDGHRGGAHTPAPRAARGRPPPPDTAGGRIRRREGRGQPGAPARGAAG